MTQRPDGSLPGSADGFGRILVGVDFSASSQAALRLARRHFPAAQRLLVHVTDARVTAAPDLMGGVVPSLTDPALLHTMEAADAQRLQALVQEGEELAVLVGDPVTGLLDSARRWGADLIVVGTHAQSALEHFFVGSTAEKIVSRSAVPVLTVRGGAA
ncbi:universal stress protein [Deinococcus arcticus]|uniref:Universal stress protein n=1 Tax=Deinococcus arcticus TaxID=2136176 RepID=A0A2T3WA71_9DEIO|nr:universal stress protein [Deinococcus arcticus]PTA68653.1 universal stress protein [Deinococcus arcticus]